MTFNVEHQLSMQFLKYKFKKNKFHDYFGADLNHRFKSNNSDFNRPY